MNRKLTQSKDELKVYSSKLYYLVAFLGSLLFVLIGVLIVLKTTRPWVGWMSILFFGGCMLLGSRELFTKTPRLYVNDEGVFDRTLGIGTIKWKDITGAQIQIISRNTFICLELTNEEEYLKKLSKIKKRLALYNQNLGFSKINLNLSGIKTNPENILRFILAKIDDKSL